MKNCFILASNNSGKLEEFRRVLEPLGIEIKTASQAGFEPVDPEETGESFAENAYIKAKAFCELTGMPCIADDSGLCVDYLGGAPGVHSARYSGDHDFESNIDKLLFELDGVPDAERGAHFECHICCLYPSGERLECSGRCDGKIGYERRGDGGFGFDPVFILSDGRSFAEMTCFEKDSMSHRGKALEKFTRLLEKR